MRNCIDFRSVMSLLQYDLCQVNRAAAGSQSLEARPVNEDQKQNHTHKHTRSST